MSYLPALLMLQHDASALGGILLTQFFWLAVLMSLALLVHRAAKRHIGAVGIDARASTFSSSTLPCSRA